MPHSIAVVGMACRYPDARSPSELWENVLAQRRAFRRLPPERLRLEDYFSTDRDAPDSLYSTQAALIEGYEFDRVRFRVAGSTFRAADWTHWLALDVATQALGDAGFADGANLPRETTGVFLGNTLTGEFSRANVLRLRWPYVRRVVEATLVDEDLPTERRLALLKKLETTYKAPFPATGEESLAGGLSNTIAGRICNYFDLKGGGYTVDGACASSLLAVAQACTALVAGDLDVALAGGVDLSMDPFELVGFAKTGALAHEMMRVYDTRSQGFWPGEGCGFVLLMRHADAMAEQLPVYATIRGWGISSDGNGGITRPEVEGQLLALQRAYRRAGFGIETVAYFEGHGTGTSVGDATELRSLSLARRQAAPEAEAAVIGSLKANIGHTKAAAGIAGLIKAVMSLKTRILPPTTGCEDPHPELKGEAPALRVLKQGESWPRAQHLRAGVSSMGFGGINAHVVLEGDTGEHAHSLNFKERMLLSSFQDAELFLLGAKSVGELHRQVEYLESFAFKLSRAELSDLAAQLERTLDQTQVRAAVVASSPAELAERLARLKALIADGAQTTLDIQGGLFFSSTAHQQSTTPRIGFLFPGQGSPVHLDGGALRRRFSFVAELYERAHFAQSSNEIATVVAQPAIVTASLAALRVLERLDLTAHVAVGHSLGELTALHWAGAMDEAALLRLATVRGKAMMEVKSPPGAMASIAAGREEVSALLNGERVNLAGLNGPGQTVISGETPAIEALLSRAARQGLRSSRLPVSHAFHSPLVAEAAPVLAAHLAQEQLQPIERNVFSTITGTRLLPQTDLRALLYQQITNPVLFMDAVLAADAAGVELWIEVGPGRVLCGLTSELVQSPVVSIDADGRSLAGLLKAAGAAFTLGVQLNHATLFEGRFTRNFKLDWQPKFFANPCELAPLSETDYAEPHSIPQSIEDAKADEGEAIVESSPEPEGASALEIIVHLVAARAELPLEAVKHDSRMLDDLHLNSITVGQLVAEAARRLGVPPPLSPTDYADATVAAIAEALTAQSNDAHLAPELEHLPAGVATWVRPFTVELVESVLRPCSSPAIKGSWQVFAGPAHPLADALQEAFAVCGAGRGCIVCLSPEDDEAEVSLLLEAARAVVHQGEETWFVLVQQGAGAAAFARTLHLEATHVNTCVVDVPFAHPRAVEFVVAEALAARGYSEAHYDPDGRRYEAVMRSQAIADSSAELPLTGEDVLLVTGGAKGITAECALALARDTGARLALIGRSRLEGNSELAERLQRFAAAGIEFRYLDADVTDAGAIRAAIEKIESELGTVTGILHGAARNAPQLLSGLDEQAFRQTLAVKVEGARNLLAAVDPQRLRLLITFGSIIARTGLPGEADYGLANEWLTRLTEQWQREHPACRCLAVEWSIWSGVGMGARLGRMDALMRQGIEPITPEAGVALLLQLLAQKKLPFTSTVVMGRYRDMPTYKIEQPELPLRRYLERPRVYYPNIELVVESSLSTGTDPYLDDHQFQGERLLPAVMGLEAMAQAATALTGATEPPAFVDVNFNRSVVIPEGTGLTIRVAALVRQPGVVEVVLRSDETAFQVDHFRATCLFDQTRLRDAELPLSLNAPEDGSRQVALSSTSELYESILFHRGRFRRLNSYSFLKATECVAEIAPDGNTSWFSQYLPAGLVLGDPAARDAAIHAIQACIPQATLLPIGVDKLSLAALNPSEKLYVHAQERVQDGSTFVYDLDVIGADGLVREHWDGLRLRLISHSSFQGPWPESLLGPYIERRLREWFTDANASVVCKCDEKLSRRERSERAIQLTLGRSVQVLRLTSGKPHIAEASGVSAAHCGNLTLAVTGSGPIGCDIEQVSAQPAAVWLDLLGAEGMRLAELIARSVPEEQETSATRVWAARESLKKAGLAREAPLLFVSTEAGGWTLLSSGSLRIATWETRVRSSVEKIVIAVLLKVDDASL